MSLRALSRVAAAVVLIATVGTPILTSAPAQAASCSGSSGVTVVVDFNQLGGGIQQQCARDGGSAASMFELTGFTLDRVQSQQGFICRVAGAPADDPCVEPNGSAYWSLWWNDGKGGAWIYAATGADGLKVSPGASVAFSWNQGGGRVPPSAGPVARLTAVPSPSPTAPEPSEDSAASSTQSGGNTAPSARPTRKPSTKPSARPTRTPAAAGATTPAPAAPSASATRSPEAAGSPSTAPTRRADATPADAKPGDGKPGKTPKPTPSTAESETGQPSAPDSTSPSTPATADPLETTGSPARASDDGLPTWVAPVLVVLLFGAAAGTAVLRRRRHA